MVDTNPTLIYCAGKNERFERIAFDAGFELGAQLPNTVYHPIFFADQDWRNPDRAAYMAALAEHRPHMATVLDWERDGQLDEVLGWAEDAAQYVARVLIVPKVIGGIVRLPRRIGGAVVVLAYSVPTRFAGTCVPAWEFYGWPVHLLGGSPHKQMEIARYLDVRSVDGNMANKMAHRCLFWRREKGPKGHWLNLRDVGDGDWVQDANHEAFRRSCRNIYAAWRDRYPG